MLPQDKFFKDIEKTAFDTGLHEKIAHSLKNYEKAHAGGVAQFDNLALARERASYIRWRAIENLDKFLLEFENNLTRKGGKVLWAPDAQSALNELESILQQHQPGKIVMSKSMTTEEVGVSGFLDKAGIPYTETDLGEYVLQKAKENLL